MATYKALIEHLKECHPDYKYCCKYCRKCFNSNSWRYQHQLRHEGLRYKCPEQSCGKLYQFYYQIRDHWKKHSRRKLYTFETRDCLKGFTTKRALNYHKRIHNLDPTIKEYTCDFVANEHGDFCGKFFSRKELLDQHKRAHKKAYVTYCGKTYGWPNSCKYHQDHCDTCKSIVAKKHKQYKYRAD